MRTTLAALCCGALLALSGCGAADTRPAAEPATAAPLTQAPPSVAPPSADPAAPPTLAPAAETPAPELPTLAPPAALPPQATEPPSLADPQATPPPGVSGPASDSAAPLPPAPAGSGPTPQLPAGVAIVPPAEPAEQAAIPPDLLEKAVANLAREAGVDRSAISVVSSSAERWPDGALGCPRRGVFYTQEPRDGFRVLLSAAGATYDYRLALDGALVLCRPE